MGNVPQKAVLASLSKGAFKGKKFKGQFGQNKGFFSTKRHSVHPERPLVVMMIGFGNVQCFFSFLHCEARTETSRRKTED